MTLLGKVLLLVGCFAMAGIIAFMLRPAARQGEKVIRVRERQADRILAEMPDKLAEAAQVARQTPAGRRCDECARLGITLEGTFNAEYLGNGRYRVTYDAGPGPASPSSPPEQRLRGEWIVDLPSGQASVVTFTDPFPPPSQAP